MFVRDELLVRERRASLTDAAASVHARATEPPAHVETVADRRSPAVWRLVLARAAAR